MTKFFKGIGKGILYIIGFPFLIVGLAIACVISLFIFFFQFFKLIVLFFTGRTLFSDLDEDIKAKAILDKNNNNTPQQTSGLDLYPSTAPIYSSGYSSPMEETKSNNEEAIKETNEEAEDQVEKEDDVND